MIDQSRQEEPHPQACPICHTNVQTWREFYTCITDHCQRPSTSEDASEAVQAHNDVEQNHLMQVMLLEQQNKRLMVARQVIKGSSNRSDDRTK
jgi:hypothetical protein